MGYSEIDALIRVTAWVGQAFVAMFVPADVRSWVDRQFTAESVQEMMVNEPAVLSRYCQTRGLVLDDCRTKIFLEPFVFKAAVWAARAERTRPTSND